MVSLNLLAFRRLLSVVDTVRAIALPRLPGSKTNLEYKIINTLLCHSKLPLPV
jgi:hypothetical protein